MTPAALLAELRAAGAVLRVVGGQLQAKALPPDLAPLARAHAAELRALLELAPDQAGPGAALDPAPGAGTELPPDPSPGDTPEGWAAFLDSAPWVGRQERARILADACPEQAPSVPAPPPARRWRRPRL